MIFHTANSQVINTKDQPWRTVVQENMYPSADHSDPHVLVLFALGLEVELCSGSEKYLEQLSLLLARGAAIDSNNAMYVFNEKDLPRAKLRELRESHEEYLSGLKGTA